MRTRSDPRLPGFLDPAPAPAAGAPAGPAKEATRAPVLPAAPAAGPEPGPRDDTATPAPLAAPPRHGDGEQVVDFPLRPAPKPIFRAPPPRIAAKPAPKPGAPHLVADTPVPAAARRPRLGEILVEQGALEPGDLATVLALQAREEARFGDILLARGMVGEAALYRALARQYGCAVADLAAEPPDARLVDAIGAENCVRNGILPWKRVGGATVVICSRPGEFAEHCRWLPESFGRLRLAVAPDSDIQTALIAARHRALAGRAETRVAASESCRTWRTGPNWRYGAAALLTALALTVLAPVAAFTLLTAWAVLTLVVNTALKAGAAVIYRRARRNATPVAAAADPAADPAAVARAGLAPPDTAAPDAAMSAAAPPDATMSAAAPPDAAPPDAAMSAAAASDPAHAGAAPAPARAADALRLPVVSVLVPLFRETEIAGRLVRRLDALDYPRELLDICLVVEADDLLTQNTLAGADLPHWMRQVTVPGGAVRTKPRALNFALDFCRGSIIGVYDAEDAPEPAQIHKVVRRFAERGPSVACLQGVLDFYNPRENWLARAFAIEYAAWFRVTLPGLEKMGFAVPLGGTTLFFRRAALEDLGGWDAHNVTEDADLGIRLARHGYRTELIDTVTKEEANCRPWPWVKQRSRWIKGYAMTWGVHMRAPRRLFRELGARKFLGVQFLFLGTLSQFLLAPVLWSFWLFAVGLAHPLQGVLPGSALWILGGIFFASEILTIAVGMMAVADDEHRFLMKWVPTLHVYWPLASVAAIKGVLEIARDPFYWDKTSHGHLHRDHDIWGTKRPFRRWRTRDMTPAG